MNGPKCSECGGSLKGYPVDIGYHENIDDCVEFVEDRIRTFKRTLLKLREKKIRLLQENQI